jgi:hypothetical protein
MRSHITNWTNRKRVETMARQVARHSKPAEGARPVVFFNASTRLTGFSQNAAFSLLTSWGLRLAGISVRHFVCQGGMSHCVLGTHREDYRTPPPCESCIKQSKRLFTGAEVHWFNYRADIIEKEVLYSTIRDLDVVELSDFEFDLPVREFGFKDRLPLGQLVLPSIRWALRQHTLPDDEPTRYLLRQYILSAYNVARHYNHFLEETNPTSALIFNGIMYPEASARWVAWRRGLRVITHEVGFQPFSAFFSEGDATAYPIHISPEFELSPEQNALLDSYLEKRFQGQFTMAGIRFWPEMRGLDEEFTQKASRFRQVVPIFTNVVYDTSQVHANKIFPHMFAWLDLLLELIRAHEDTLFVIRAHPDEMRPGTAKQSRESVRDWIHRNQVDQLPNVVFIDSQEYISSYELIQQAKFVIVYNSSIGMEAALFGAAVLCGGKARYTQIPMVFFPQSVREYRDTAEDFLDRDKIDVPTHFRQNARRFLYYQLYRASLSFEDYLEEGHRRGLVKLRPFSWQELLPDNSKTMQLLVKAIPGNARNSTGNADHSAPAAFLLEEAHS